VVATTGVSRVPVVGAVFVLAALVVLAIDRWAAARDATAPAAALRPDATPRRP
jgi:hypothetical protein